MYLHLIVIYNEAVNLTEHHEYQDNNENTGKMQAGEDEDEDEGDSRT